MIFYEPARRDRMLLPHDPFKALVAPRPIGWIWTLSSDGHVNLAPYSFFNAVAEAPPMLAFSSRGAKDSATFATEVREFVWDRVRRRRHGGAAAGRALRWAWGLRGRRSRVSDDPSHVLTGIADAARLALWPDGRARSATERLPYLPLQLLLAGCSNKTLAACHTVGTAPGGTLRGSPGHHTPPTRRPRSCI